MDLERNTYKCINVDLDEFQSDDDCIENHIDRNKMLMHTQTLILRVHVICLLTE